MEVFNAVLTGVLFSAGIYLMLRRSLMKLLLGLAVISNAVNLLIFTAAGLTRGRPAFVEAGGSAPAPPFADPLPQAFILTAIVISFGVLAFAVALVMRVYVTLGTDDSDTLRSTDR
jgi:multicomponent Na+:H+ antiporter subunit C